MDHCAARIRTIEGGGLEEEKSKRLKELNNQTMEKIKRTTPARDDEAKEKILQAMEAADRKDIMAYSQLKLVAAWMHRKAQALRQKATELYKKKSEARWKKKLAKG